MGGSSSRQQPQYNPPPPPDSIMGRLYSQSQPQALFSYHQDAYAPHHYEVPSTTTAQVIPVRWDATINKGSIKLVSNDYKPNFYHLEFEYDSEFQCLINIYFFADEQIGPAGVQYIVNTSKYPQPLFLNLPPAQSQKCSQATIDISKYSPDELFFRNSNSYPIVIEIIPRYPPETSRPPQALTTYLSFERKGRNLGVFPIRQKLTLAGQTYELMEIYGFSEKQGADNSNCVICLSEKNDTTVIPCRHACLCQYCAEMLKNQGRNSCPICRGPISSFVTIKLD
ncbi:unnamed protein product [Blepharisma stoltei]|uniref:RING-type E3 ubiquitin transferase n=1 Tax=Blepharisma stoltei TaxID=1481888 RepID=A0AAU9IHS5_9CILI|nr:unnamed protein product [Blepharisma stoltei]